MVVLVLDGIKYGMPYRGHCSMMMVRILNQLDSLRCHQAIALPLQDWCAFFQGYGLAAPDIWKVLRCGRCSVLLIAFA